MSEKIGLALSGGGFRASFFHIGVLARLAELGILRKVAVISTVSGGSIVGAAYYMRVKNLLETEESVSDADYVELVRKLERTFREAVRRNIRARVWSNPVKNLQMAGPRYSRSDRIGDLYDRYLYKPIWKERHGERARKRWGAERQIELRELLIHPLDPGATAPKILINATSLNTGHNWRFEPEQMGEPLPDDERTRRVIADVDGNERLAQAYFEATGEEPAVPESQVDFPLGLAVAASACVPTLFHPLAISDMYDGIRVQLVDGGVHDNQGVQALIDEDCTHLIVSDASGQMRDVANPATRIPAVGGRSMSIYGDRIRDEQLIRVAEHARPHALLHLRKGLVPATRWAGSGRSPDFDRIGKVRCGDFGVADEAQEALARVRTDLDAFSDAEAYSLMLDGYLMTDYVAPRSRGIRDLVAEVGPAEWPFLAVAEGLAKPDGLYARQLAAAGKRFMKPLALAPRLAAALGVVLVALVGLLVWWQRGPIGDGLSGTWPAWAVVAAAGGVLLFGASYTTSSKVGRIAIDILVGSVLPLVLALPLVVVSWGTLVVGRVHLLLGRVPVEEEERPEAVSVPQQV